MGHGVQDTVDLPVRQGSPGVGGAIAEFGLELGIAEGVFRCSGWNAGFLLGTASICQ